MATGTAGGRSFREAALVRKLIYLAMIVVLFAALTFTGTFVRALTGDPTPRGEGSPLAALTLSAQRERLELNELSKGKAGVAGEAVRLGCTLTGSRGAAVTILWATAIEKQKRHEWNEVELLVDAITTLQPRFRTPWLFQSWNLAYNVSVESDRPGDKYYYIARGIQKLAEGEAQNRGDPDMRYWVGFYYLNKFGVSDENNFLRSLLQLSCVDPKEREGLPVALKDRDDADRRLEDLNSRAERLKEAGKTAEADALKGEIDTARKTAGDARDRFNRALEKFVGRHPQFVRRVKEILRRSRPEDLVEFVADHAGIPSRFQEDVDPASAALSRFTPLKSKAGERFPVLPEVEFDTQERREFVNDDPADQEGAAAGTRVIDDTFDNYLAARSWMAYAQLPLPPLPRTEKGEGVPSRTPRINEYDHQKYRVPKAPMLVIFRQYPCRAQSYVGERLLKEGWFDADGWVMEDGDTPSSDRWFPADPSRPESAVRRYGAGREWARDAWKLAHDLWDAYGRDNGLILEPGRREEMEAKSEQFRTKYGVQQSDIQREFRRSDFPDGPVGDEEFRGSQYHLQLLWYEQNRHVTNFAHFLRRSLLESNPRTVHARKLVAQAERSRGNQARAIDLWQQGFDEWRRVLRADQRDLNPVERKEVEDLLRDTTVMEDLYERYLRFRAYMEEARVGRPEKDGTPEASQGARPDGAREAALMGVGPESPLAGVAGTLAGQIAYQRTFYLPLEGMHPAINQPWFNSDVITQVQQRLKPPTKAPPGPTPPPGPEGVPGPGGPVPPPPGAP